MRQQKILEFNELPEVRKKLQNKKIVHCHGVFDLLHAGHLAYFESAKRFGEFLVVTITADEFVNKGPGRPYFNSMVRANMVAALGVVDYVAISRFPTAEPAIEALKPNFYVKGPDYKDKALDPTGAIYREEYAVQKHGGKLVFTEDDTFSSSTLINKFFAPWTDEQQKTIESIKQAGGFEAIEEVLDKVAQQKVCIVGEPIVDTYVFCAPEALSSKSPSVSAKYISEEDYAGGSLAIANHLAGFTKEVSLLFTHGGEDYFQKLLQNKMNSKVQITAQELPNCPTPRKTRFITFNDSQRIFEITHLRSDQWTNHSPKEFCQMMDQKIPKADVTILADFGHGLFEGEVLQSVSKIEGFTALNVQSNSSNFGFNPFTKHKKFSYLSLDQKEARIAFHDRNTASLDLARKIRSVAPDMTPAIAMTLGAGGSYYLPARKSEEHFVPTFADSIVDTTGAGDAFFAITSMLVRVGCPEIFIPFVGNVFAGLKAKIIGNKEAVPRAQLIKAITSILK